MKKTLFIFLFSSFIFLRATSSCLAVESSYSGNFIVPEAQSGFREENYEVRVGEKLLRGLQNAFLSPLEISHGVKSEYYYRKQEVLPMSAESFFVGSFKGFLNMFGRLGVGLYEVFTFSWPQDPILPEMKDWLY